MPVLSHQHRPLKISLTPLIDVVFIMLLFFMLASTFSQWQQLSLSSVAKGRQLMSDSLPVQLFVLGNNTIRHKGVEYSLGEDSSTTLLNSFARKDAYLLVTAESRATIQDVVMVMDRVIDAGVENVSLTSSFDER